MKIKKLSILVPVYNEEKTLEQVLEKLNALDLSCNKEIIIIDDSSADNSRKIMEKFRDRMTILFHKENMGKGAAIQTGLGAATGDYVIIQDADLEYNPEDIKKLKECAEREACLAVYGTRNRGIKNKYLYPHFYFGSKILTGMINILYRQNLSDPETCYKLIERNLLKSLVIQENGFGMEIEITAKISKLGVRIREVPIRYEPRSFREGKKITTKDGVWAFYLVWKYLFKI